MSILETANELLDAIEEHSRIERERKAHVSLVDAWFEQCRLRAVAQNPQTYQDLNSPL